MMHVVICDHMSTSFALMPTNLLQPWKFQSFSMVGNWVCVCVMFGEKEEVKVEAWKKMFQCFTSLARDGEQQKEINEGFCVWKTFFDLNIMDCSDVALNNTRTRRSNTWVQRRRKWRDAWKTHLDFYLGLWEMLQNKETIHWKVGDGECAHASRQMF